MITPSFSLTATERVLPRLALDFTTGILDSRVTITRSLNTATRVNNSGLIELVNADLPRFDYSPVTLGLPLGLLIEETRINLLSYSQAFNDVSYTKGAISVNQNITGLDGVTNTAATITASAGTGSHWFYKSFTATAVPYTQSVYAKAGTTNWLGISFGGGADADGAFFNLTTGVVGLTAFNSTATIRDAGNGWYRCTVTRTLGAGTYFGALEVHTNNNQILGWNAVGTETICLFGLQMEAGAFATSYIPTTSTSLTRNADQAAMTGTNFSSWYNATEGTFYSEFTPIATTAAGGGTILMTTDGTKNGYGFYKGSSSSSLSTIVGSNSSVIGSITVGNTQKAILGYNSTNIRSGLNRNGLFTTATASVGSLSALYLGRSWYAGDFMSGHIRKTSYWPQKLTDAELTANTY